MQIIVVVFWGVLTFILLALPDLPAKILYKNTKDRKKARWHVRTKLGSVALLVFVLYYFKFIY